MISAMITATAIPEVPEMENMFPEAPGIPEEIQPAPEVPVWQQAADRIFHRTGNHWCIDQGGKWFQFKDGSYPVGRWCR